MKQIWIVVKYWPGGKQENSAAFIHEEAARYYASTIIGKDDALIALQTIGLDETIQALDECSHWR